MTPDDLDPIVMAAAYLAIVFTLLWAMAEVAA